LRFRTWFCSRGRVTRFIESGPIVLPRGLRSGTEHRVFVHHTFPYHSERRPDMKQRVAKKILKYREKLDYTPDQLKRAEQRLNARGKDGADGDQATESRTDEKTA